MRIIGRIGIMIFRQRRSIPMLPITPIFPISSPRAAKKPGLRMEDMRMIGIIGIMVFRQRRSIPMLPITPILPISSPRAAKEPGLRSCGWEAHDEEGLGDQDFG
jgi:hypothetical protein